MIPFAVVADELAELAPMLRRAVDLDPASLARVRIGPGTVSVLVRLPFRVLVARTVASHGELAPADVTFGARELLSWLDGTRIDPPMPRDGEWRGGVPPYAGWRRVDTVADEAIRTVVRAGAQALQDAAVREGLPGGQPRAEVADVLLDSVVLTATAESGDASAALTLRTLSALTRMGFLARDSHAHIDRSGRWTRLAGAYGSVYAEEPGGLSIASS